MVSDCVFQHNVARFGGAVYVADFLGRQDNTVNYLPPVVSNSTFFSNVAEEIGGGIHVFGLQGAFLVVDCNFTTNVASQLGGGIALET